MLERIEQGQIVTLEINMSITDLEWHKHPAFEGVFLRHIVTGNLTEGNFSCHLVKVQAGCEISEHIHQNNWELHEVMAGEGIGYLAQKRIPYALGTTIVIPADKKHKVAAGEEDLYLLATFIPALL
jgi:quercetin dioxygenase-like cupin family protein